MPLVWLLTRTRFIVNSQLQTGLLVTLAKTLSADSHFLMTHTQSLLGQQGCVPDFNVEPGPGHRFTFGDIYDCEVTVESLAVCSGRDNLIILAQYSYHLLASQRML